MAGYYHYYFMALRFIQMRWGGCVAGLVPIVVLINGLSREKRGFGGME